MNTHDLKQLEAYPNYHFWNVANRMNLYSNVEIQTGDTIKHYNKTYKVGIMFPDINDKNYVEDGLNPNITKDTEPILYHNCTSEVVNNPELPFITNKTKFYEFLITEECL